MLKLNNIECKKVFEKIMPICLALFFCRTVFIGYKYLFFLLLVPCVVYSAFCLLKNGIAKPKWRKIGLPLLVVVLFLAHFTPVNNVVKESVNLFLILYFITFADLYYAENRHVTFLKCILCCVEFAGLLALLRYVFNNFGVQLPYEIVWYEKSLGTFSLVRDYNFYSVFFILSIVCSLFLLAKQCITKLHFILINVISVLMVVSNSSRRAFILYLILLVISIIYIGNSLYRVPVRLHIKIMAVLLSGTVFATLILKETICEKIVSNREYSFAVYKIYSIFSNKHDHWEINSILWNKVVGKSDSDTNLFYNGDLKSGLKYWRSEHRPPDSIIMSFHVEEKDPFIRIEKKNSIYGWSLRYMGRPIYYHSGCEYTFSFRYRVIKGVDEAPFRVGLWVKEKSGYIDNLRKEIIPFDSVWRICMVKHSFESDQVNPTCLLNCQLPNTIIDIKNICLTVNDSLNLPKYADQIPDSVIFEMRHKDDTEFDNNANALTITRTDRWRYARELWQTRYNTKQKIFGHGFDYLKWYGEKFHNNPDRHDFPHNPIISSFLYSGIIGGVVYIIFLIMSLWLYWKKRQQLGIFFIMYLCCMFFCMFSGSSHFSFPLFVFLSFLPFVEKRVGDKRDMQPACSTLDDCK